jgi:hypothetical protein
MVPLYAQAAKEVKEWERIRNVLHNSHKDDNITTGCLFCGCGEVWYRILTKQGCLSCGVEMLWTAHINTLCLAPNQG